MRISYLFYYARKGWRIERNNNKNQYWAVVVETNLGHIFLRREASGSLMDPKVTESVALEQ